MNAVEQFRQAALRHTGQIIFTAYPAFRDPHSNVVPPYELDAYLTQPGEDAVFVDGDELKWHRKPGGSFTDGGSNNSLWLKPAAQ